MTRFTAIDLARLPAQPRTAQTFEAIYAAYMVDLTQRLAVIGIDYTVGMLESDTYAVTGEAFAFRTQLVQVSVDDAIAAVLLPTSFGAYLDLLGATQSPAVQRNVIAPATDTTPVVMEQDEPFRGRIQLAPEALSTCGPEGAYLWFTLAVPDVLAASCYGPMSFGGTRAAPFVPLGEVHIPVVSGIGDGTADAALVAAVGAAVSGDERRPIADLVTPSAAVIAPFVVNALLDVGPGADRATVLIEAFARARAMADLAHRPGGQVLDQDLYAALKVPDTSGRPIVGKVTLHGWADVNGTDPTPATPAPAYIAPYCAPPLDGEPVFTALDDATTQLVAGGMTLAVRSIDD